MPMLVSNTIESASIQAIDFKSIAKDKARCFILYQFLTRHEIQILDVSFSGGCKEIFRRPIKLEQPLIVIFYMFFS